MKKKNEASENYLERIPQHPEGLKWSTDNDGRIMLHIENKKFFDKIAQKFFKRPKVSYIHLDDMGTFIWPLINGERDLIEIGKFVDEHFGEDAHPLYERIAKYFKILDSYGFVSWKK